jgi:hypothetical protein
VKRKTLALHWVLKLTGDWGDGNWANNGTLEEPLSIKCQWYYGIRSFIGKLRCICQSTSSNFKELTQWSTIIKHSFVQWVFYSNRYTTIIMKHQHDYHHHRHKPTVQKDVPERPWTCPFSPIWPHLGTYQRTYTLHTFYTFGTFKVHFGHVLSLSWTLEFNRSYAIIYMKTCSKSIVILLFINYLPVKVLWNIFCATAPKGNTLKAGHL